MKRNYALGARLKAAMKAAGFKTAKVFCEAYNIHYLTVAQHIQGRRHPSPEFLKLYSDAFGITTNWIETGKGNPFSNQKRTQQVLTLSEKEMDKRLKIDGLLQIIVDQSLLSKILEQLFKKKFNLNTNDAKKFSKAASYIYSEIVNMDEDETSKDKFIEIAVNTFLNQIEE